MTARSRGTLLMAGFTVVCYVLLFTSKYAPWHDFAPLLLLWALVGLAGTFCMVMENTAQPTRQAVRVPIENSGKAS